MKNSSTKPTEADKKTLPPTTEAEPTDSSSENEEFNRLAIEIATELNADPEEEEVRRLAGIRHFLQRTKAEEAQ